jgi:tripartite-type tricarboxylate transporter receptor subunit TctC
MKHSLFGALCGSLLALATGAFAEPIKFVVPFAAGGPVDQTARILTNELGLKLGEDIIVDDRGGAGGAIAGEFVARSAPDGKTVLFGSFGAFVLGPILKPPANYDPVKSFEPVMLVGKVPSLVVVNKDSGISTLADLIAKAKQQKLRPAITDLLGNHIDTMNADLPVLMPLAKAGTVKALALFAPERTPQMPDLPTTKELGYPTVVMENWYGIFLPAGTPPQIRDRLEQALLSVIATPAIAQRLADNGIRGTLGHEAFAADLDKQFAEWPGRFKTLGITGE